MEAKNKSLNKSQDVSHKSTSSASYVQNHKPNKLLRPLNQKDYSQHVTNSKSNLCPNSFYSKSEKPTKFVEKSSSFSNKNWSKLTYVKKNMLDTDVDLKECMAIFFWKA